MNENVGLASRVGRRGGSPAQAGALAAAQAALRRLRVGFSGLPASVDAAPCGIAHSVAVRQCLNSPRVAARLMSRRILCARKAVPLTLALTDLGPGRDALSNLQRFCEFLRTLRLPAGVAPAPLCFALHAHQLPLRAYLVLTGSVPGCEARYVFVDNLQMQVHRDSRVREVTRKNWRTLWQHRHAGSGVLPIYSGVVRSACPLLSDEIARTVLPGRAMMVPQDSAWLPLRIRLTDFVHRAGRVDWARLSPALCETLRVADRLHDLYDWPDRKLATDAKLHRRIALSLDALGDAVLCAGFEPGSHAALAWLTSVTRRIRVELQQASSALARESGALPAVLRSDPSMGLKAGPLRDQWQQRWQAAVRSSALRHRNLLVMSPYSVLSGSGNDVVRFIDLLPVIRFADAWCFSPTASLARCSLRDYQSIHRRAWAVLKGHSVGYAVAAGV